MSDQQDQQQPEESAPRAAGQDALQALMSGLDLTPDWARDDQPSTTYTREPGRRDDRGERRRPDRKPGRRDGRDGRDARSGDKPRRDPKHSFSRDDRGERRDGKKGGPHRPFRREERVRLPVEVSFIPDRDRLGAVVRQLHAVRRAFPLPYLAHLFMVKPEHHWIKLEAKGVQGGEPMQFYQDRVSKAVFLEEGRLREYLAGAHLERHYDRVEEAMEPPSGNFVCVGRCRISGKLLGPPNYHGFNEKVQETHRLHAAHLPLDQYRNNIEMVREPEVIEQWKESCRSRVRYKPKDAGEESTASFSVVQAEQDFHQRHAAAYVHSGSKIIMPGSAVSLLVDEPLRQSILAARTREDRFPFTMMLAVRPAFRRMRLHVFKAGKDHNYVTAIPPRPIDAEHAIESIKEMIHLIAEHPGWTRQQLVDKLFPGSTMDDPAVAEKLSPLGWLVEKGHVIEFFNGAFAIPGHLRMIESLPTEKPQEHHHPELNQAASAPVPEASDVSVSSVPEELAADDNPAEITPPEEASESKPLPPPAPDAPA
jgi:hypothetical protein